MKTLIQEAQRLAVFLNVTKGTASLVPEVTWHGRRLRAAHNISLTVVVCAQACAS